MALPPLYIIIDEYDNFTNQLIQSHNDGLYRSLTNPDQDSFLKSFFKVIKAGIQSALEMIRHAMNTEKSGSSGSRLGSHKNFV